MLQEGLAWKRQQQKISAIIEINFDGLLLSYEQYGENSGLRRDCGGNCLPYFKVATAIE